MWLLKSKTMGLGLRFQMSPEMAHASHDRKTSVGYSGLCDREETVAKPR